MPLEAVVPALKAALIWQVPRLILQFHLQLQYTSKNGNNSLQYSVKDGIMSKSVLITGCSPGGIGHALAREFKSKGLRVFATARKAETIADLSSQGIETLSLDVTNIGNIEALKDEISSRTGGRLDILVNNAGRNYTVPALHVQMDEIRATFETNVFAVMMLCQAFAPLLIESRGTIVQIGSLAGKMVRLAILAMSLALWLTNVVVQLSSRMSLVAFITPPKRLFIAIVTP